MDAKKIEDIAKQINDSIPSGVKDFAGNMEQRIKTILQQQLGKLDVVTHEELDVQQQLLLRLRQRVEQLEQQVQQLQQDTDSND
jgi:BMFP domain-containing protein YqiC